MSNKFLMMYHIHEHSKICHFISVVVNYKQTTRVLVIHHLKIKKKKRTKTQNKFTTKKVDSKKVNIQVYIFIKES